ncbi:hypothetical protein HT105_22215, partial [Bacteroides fragilis]|nr:hypothetical protein [Bacteroides fragilis]
QVTVSQPQDIYLPNGFEGDAGEARVVPTESLVAGLAAISVYEPDNPDTDSMVSVMRDAARSMRVDKPAHEDAESILVKSREMLAAGGEQVTVLTSLKLMMITCLRHSRWKQVTVSQPQDIYLPNGFEGDAGEARVVPTESLV